MTNPDRGELVKLNEAGLEAAVRECARITAPEITNDEYERIKADNSPRYQNTRTEMARAIRAYLRAAKPALSSIVTCCVTGAIPGDGGACGDCDPCLLGEASVPAPVKTLIAEKNSLIHRVGELEDELDSLRRLGYRKSGCKSMIERVAKALCEENKPFDINWQTFIPEARAALMAMREPTDLMIDSACAARIPLYPAFEGQKPQPTAGEVIIAEYRAMIDAALQWPAGSADRAGAPMAED